MTPQIEIEGDTATVKGPRGFMRMLLTGALTDANLWQRAQGASPETRQRWARRAIVMRGLLDAMPAPPSTRDPFEDLGEEAPSAAPAVRYFYHPESDSLFRTSDGSRPGTDGLVEEISEVEFDRIAALQAAHVGLSADVKDLAHEPVVLTDDILGLLG